MRHQGESCGAAFSQREVLAEDIVPFLSPTSPTPTPTEPQSWQVGATSETPATWLTLFVPPQ